MERILPSEGIQYGSSCSRDYALRSHAFPDAPRPFRQIIGIIKKTQTVIRIPRRTQAYKVQ